VLFVTENGSIFLHGQSYWLQTDTGSGSNDPEGGRTTDLGLQDDSRNVAVSDPEAKADKELKLCESRVPWRSGMGREDSPIP